LFRPQSAFGYSPFKRRDDFCGGRLPFSHLRAIFHAIYAQFRHARTFRIKSDSGRGNVERKRFIYNCNVILRRKTARSNELASAALSRSIPIESEDLDTTLAVVSHGFEVKLETGRKIERRPRRVGGRDAARRAPREERQKEKAAARRPSFLRRFAHEHEKARTRFCTPAESIAISRPTRESHSHIPRNFPQIDIFSSRSWLIKFYRRIIARDLASRRDQRANAAAR